MCGPVAKKNQVQIRNIFAGEQETSLRLRNAFLTLIFITFFNFTANVHAFFYISTSKSESRVAGA